MLPHLCTYSSMSPGMSKLMTCFTLEMSRPRAATAVATMMGVWPHLNLDRVHSLVMLYTIDYSDLRSASSLSFWERSPWMLVTGKPSL